MTVSILAGRPGKHPVARRLRSDGEPEQDPVRITHQKNADVIGGLVNGPAHFQKAEEILAGLGQRSYSGETEIGLALQALTHATLANTAAAALGTSPTESRAWAEVAGTKLSGT